MVNNRDLGLDGVARFLLFADYGDRPWVYWRPGWALLFWLVHGVAGTVAWPYYLVCIALHAAQSGAIAAIGSRASGSCLTGASAGVLFAVMPSHAGAVAWIAAAFNVVPAALCVLIAGWCCWRFANEGRARHGVAVVALTALSLTFKEAAYAMPLVAAAAISLVPTAVRWRRRVARFWLVGALAILVVAHHLAVGRRDPVADGLAPDAFALALAHHAAAYARSVLPFLPNDDVVALGLAAALGVVVFVWGSPRVRFLAAWTLAATLPYVVMAHGERFFYFCHAPAVLCATLFARELAQRCGRSPHVAHAAWLAVAALGLVRLPAALAWHEAQGEQCRRIWQFVAAHGLQHERELIVDGVPLSLENGFEAMLELFGRVPPQVRHLQALPRPPFLLYLDPALAELPPTTPMLRLGSVATPERTTLAAFVGDLVPLPLLSLVHAYEVADAAAVDAALARRDRSLATRPLLDAAPPCAPEPPGAHRISDLAVRLQGTTCTVECERSALLLIAFPVPVELLPPGRVLVDDAPVPVRRANGMLHAICVPAGRHVVTLQPAPGAR